MGRRDDEPPRRPLDWYVANEAGYSGDVGGVTLLLLTAMSLAAAEGPWVLWSKLTFRDGEGWLVNRAFDSADECRAAAAAALRETAGRGNTVVGGSVKTANGEITPVCLPDTVDPRGPKGK